MDVSALSTISPDQAAGATFGIRIVLDDLPVRHGSLYFTCVDGFVFHLARSVQADKVLGSGKLNPETREHGDFIMNIHLFPNFQRRYRLSVFTHNPSKVSRDCV